jgi:uncharacterized protein YodC (DUF2158 family)
LIFIFKKRILIIIKNHDRRKVSVFKYGIILSIKLLGFQSIKEYIMSAVLEYQIGEIVKLKSGGPDMTVKNKANASGSSYHCQWFAGKKLEQGQFSVESLEYVKKDK